MRRVRQGCTIVAPTADFSHRGSRFGITLVEIACSTLILALLLHGVVNLMIVTSQRYSREEETLICMNEAAFIFYQLRRDLRRCVFRGKEVHPYEKAKSAVKFQEDTSAGQGVAGFDILEKDKPFLVQYEFTLREKSLRRGFNGETILMGQGRVIKFVVLWQILGKDGIIRSFPPDPQLPPEPPLPKDWQFLRGWAKVSLTLEGHGKNPLKQDFVSRIFPVPLNKELSTLWCSKAP